MLHRTSKASKLLMVMDRQNSGEVIGDDYASKQLCAERSITSNNELLNIKLDDIAGKVTHQYVCFRGSRFEEAPRRSDW